MVESGEIIIYSICVWYYLPLFWINSYLDLSFSCSSNLILQTKQSLSTHEKELEKLRAEIEEMERANLEPKTWTMQGEVMYFDFHMFFFSVLFTWCHCSQLLLWFRGLVKLLVPRSYAYRTWFSCMLILLSNGRLMLLKDQKIVLWKSIWILTKMWDLLLLQQWRTLHLLKNLLWNV